MAKYKIKTFDHKVKEIELPDDVKPSAALFDKVIEEGKAKDFQYAEGWKGKLRKFLDTQSPASPVGYMGSSKKANLFMEDLATVVPIVGGVAKALKNILQSKEEERAIRERNKGLFMLPKIAGSLTFVLFLWLILLQKLKKISQQIKNQKSLAEKD